MQFAAWPTYDASMLVEITVERAVTVNAKKRVNFQIAKDPIIEEAQAAATALPHVKEFLEGKEIKKVIVVPNKIVNIVAK